MYILQILDLDGFIFVVEELFKDNIYVFIYTMSVFVQIGTNNGNDLFRKLVLKHKPAQVILVEPNPQLYSTIQKNYEGIPNVSIVSKAIYYDDNVPVELYIAAKNKVYGSRADNGWVLSDVHFTLVPMNDWGEKSDMVTINTEGIRFDTLCSMHNIKVIDYLQIDTEGFDSEIIKMIDFSKYIIHQLRFEKWNFDSKLFTKHNASIAERLGTSGMNTIQTLLSKMGYTFFDIKDIDGDDVVVTIKSLDEVRNFYELN